MAHKRKKKGMFGVSEDLVQLGQGVLGSAIVVTAINKFAGGMGHRRGGGGEDEQVPDAAINPVMQGIGEISAKFGVPKAAVIKGVAGVAFVYAAEKMPQHRTAFLFIAGILFWDALTSHQKVREYMGINGTVLAGTEELNKIEDDLRKELAACKEIMGLPGSPAVNGTVLAGSELAGMNNGIYDSKMNYAALGL